MNGEVIVDVIDLGQNTGFSLKMMGCVAFARLVLFDRKKDFRECLAKPPKQVMYRDADHVNAPVDKYLGDPTGVLIFCQASSI